MKSELKHVSDHGVEYDALLFTCPGCQEFGGSGFHLLPVNTTATSPSWDWNGNLDAPTISPSILTTHANDVCHSFLRDGVFEFLGDCTHSLAGQSVPMPEIPTAEEG